MAAQSACQRVSIENAVHGSVTLSCDVAEHVPVAAENISRTTRMQTLLSFWAMP